MWFRLLIWAQVSSIVSFQVFTFQLFNAVPSNDEYYFVYWKDQSTQPTNFCSDINDDLGLNSCPSCSLISGCSAVKTTFIPYLTSTVASIYLNGGLYGKDTLYISLFSSNDVLLDTYR